MDNFTEQNLLTCQNILKEVYEPLWNNRMSTDPSILLTKIKKSTLTGENIVAGAPIGLNGGFGFGSEGNDTPEAGYQMYDNYRLTAKDMFTNVKISDKTILLAKNPGAMADALSNEIESAYITAKWNVGRSLFGNGTGKLAKVSSASGKKIKVDTTKYIRVGLTIDVYSDESTVVSAKNRIVNIARTADGEGKYEVTLQKAVSTTVTDGFITIQNSLNRELTGLGAIFDDSITSLYGVSRTDNEYMKPEKIDAQGDISDSVIFDAMRTVKNYKNGDVDFILCGYEAYKKYIEYLRTNNVRVENSDGTIEGGFASIKYQFGTKKVEIACEEFVPDNEAWGINTSDVELRSTPWAFATVQGSSIFTLLENKSVYRALLRSYGELICKNMGGFFKITNC